MLQLKNMSPFAPSIALFPDRYGIDTLYVIVKATLQLFPVVTLAEQQVPPTAADEYFGDAATSSLKYASEMHLGKPGTDVVLVGSANAPRGRERTDLLVIARVAERTKAVQVFGDRTWLNDSDFTQPEPFVTMPLVYERAYGGTHAQTPELVLAEERNPVGAGFRGKRSGNEMRGSKLPNLEDPRKLLRRSGDQPGPAGFGFVAASWLPRRNYAGTYDATWQRSRAPYLPDDFDPRFFNAASPDLTFDRYLQGGESVALDNVHPEGRLNFTLPNCRLELSAKVRGSTKPTTGNLETVVIEPDLNRLCMTWRAALPCDKHVLEVEEITVALDGMTGVA